MTPKPLIAIGVPVRDEAARLPRLLAAFAGQAGVDLRGVAVAFLLDGCADDSAAIVRGWRAPCGVIAEPVPRASPNAGRARRAAMALAAETGAGLLLTTDADGAPAPDWIAAAVRALAHADVVTGRIKRRPPAAPDAGGPTQDRVELYFDRLHAHRRALDPVAWDPAPGHHHTGGANMGFRADAYHALGGFDPVPAGEDAGMIDRAHRLGLRVRREPAMLVETSGRRRGRAPGGLADALARLDAGDEPIVAHPEDEAWRYRAQAMARAAHPRLPGGADRLAASLGLPPAEVLQVADECANAEAFAMRIAPPPPGGPRLVPLMEAEAALDAIARGGRGAAA